MSFWFDDGSFEITAIVFKLSITCFAEAEIDGVLLSDNANFVIITSVLWGNSIYNR